MVKKLGFILAVSALCLVGSTGLLSRTEPDDVSITDIEGNRYRVVRIGGQVWMAENLRVTKTSDGTPVESFFYEDNEEQYGHLGRLYKWDAAMTGARAEKVRGIAPAGWHIPSAEEWRALFRYLEKSKISGRELLKDGKTGFDALLEGGADFRGKYLYLGTYSMFWSSTETNDERALHFGVSKDGSLDEFAAMKGARIAVRCIKDSPEESERSME
jgi:uncharacterized protein (TIGR02145 family)